MDESYKMHNFVVHEQKKYMYMDYKCSRHGHNFLPNSIYHMIRSFGEVFPLANSEKRVSRLKKSQFTLMHVCL